MPTGFVSSKSKTMKRASCTHPNMFMIQHSLKYTEEHAQFRDQAAAKISRGE
jgi:hypothetical protein